MAVTMELSLLMDILGRNGFLSSALTVGFGGFPATGSSIRDLPDRPPAAHSLPHRKRTYALGAPPQRKRWFTGASMVLPEVSLKATFIAENFAERTLPKPRGILTTPWT